MSKLSNKTIAILTETGFEESELLSPKEALEKEGATVHVISPADRIKGWKNGNWTEEVRIDKGLGKANPDDYHALVIPGGVINPDKLRANEHAVAFIKAFFAQGKPVAAICHGPQVLIETGALDGRTMTSWPSIKTDLINAGVNWVDEECVCDSGLVTARKPDDLPAFNKKLIEEIREGVHQEQNTL
ncbi:type 1 glutamine amidotransferase domain-containing protein [Pararhodonellum marinum]|uniref:type 1 glutamine amidotransferase domain-containing protein n=1 Tax=Pararhodonellum marinum TaxID=2755358 RepID=UPI0018904601|nr:type 1 glutamine amidotransferase domain-containing protein [Pararhodonellum marinum]